MRLPRLMYLIIAHLATVGNGQAQSVGTSPQVVGTTSPQEVNTTADKPLGYYVRSPLFSFYMTPNKTIKPGKATHVLTQNVNNCTCRNACLAAIGCESWALVKLPNGSFECRLSDQGPYFDLLQVNPDSTYFFRERASCIVVYNGAGKNITIFPEYMLEDVARGKHAESSRASSTAEEAGNAVEDSNAYFSSQSAPYNWWVVDLGSRRTIFHIQILPRREDCCADRFRDVEVHIGDKASTNGDFSSYTLLHFYKGPYESGNGWLSYYCSGATGRYISVSINNAGNQLEMMSFLALASKRS